MEYDFKHMAKHHQIIYMRKFRTIIVVLLMTGNGLVWAGWDEANAALEQGDYATSVREFRTLAEQGHVDSQYNLAHMYAGGKGVPQDYKEADRWWRKAADQGDLDAQYNLGVM